MFLLIILASQTFYPNWPIFLHGYIRHIRDIFQLCVICSGPNKLSGFHIFCPKLEISLSEIFPRLRNCGSFDREPPIYHFHESHPFTHLHLPSIIHPFTVLFCYHLPFSFALRDPSSLACPPTLWEETLSANSPSKILNDSSLTRK